MDLRCESKKHAEIFEEPMHKGLLEVKCDSRFCGAGPGRVVLHRFDLETGFLVNTRRFKTPTVRKESEHASDSDSASVRSA
jgi:hypothetical protein